uniref:Uncharacterized protein n=1 Tax=Human herpesvirus 1 TaxID=10298 RepID=A0A2Z4H9R0_HHV1|nr:hypothetical protein [Human alphaherpesvirus 1]
MSSSDEEHSPLLSDSRSSRRLSAGSGGSSSRSLSERSRPRSISISMSVAMTGLSAAVGAGVSDMASGGGAPVASDRARIGERHRSVTVVGTRLHTTTGRVVDVLIPVVPGPALPNPSSFRPPGGGPAPPPAQTRTNQTP